MNPFKGGFGDIGEEEVVVDEVAFFDGEAMDCEDKLIHGIMDEQEAIGVLLAEYFEFEMDEPAKSDKSILSKYFILWKYFTVENNSDETKDEAIRQSKKKIDKLILQLAKHKIQRQENALCSKKATKEPNNFKQRFEAQKNHIEKLSSKLEEKDRVIEELKMGFFNKEALDCLNKAKIDIREIFANCSAKFRCKVAPPPDFRNKFMVSTQKAPRIAQEMEAKALARAKRYQEILDRKCLLVEERQKMIKEALEKKAKQDEEERKKSLQKIDEERRKELEKKRRRNANKEIFLEKMKKAIDLNNTLLTRRAFFQWYEFHVETKATWEMSVRHYKVTLMSKMLGVLKVLLEMKYRDKNALADAVYARNILSRTLDAWKEMRMESIRSLQVAEDYYDFYLLNNTFIHWHRFVCIQIMAMETRMQLADRHNRNIFIDGAPYQLSIC